MEMKMLKAIRSDFCATSEKQSNNRQNSKSSNILCTSASSEWWGKGRRAQIVCGDLFLLSHFDPMLLLIVSSEYKYAMHTFDVSSACVFFILFLLHSHFSRYLAQYLSSFFLRLSLRLATDPLCYVLRCSLFENRLNVNLLVLIDIM